MVYAWRRTRPSERAIARRTAAALAAAGLAAAGGGSVLAGASSPAAAPAATALSALLPTGTKGNSYAGYRVTNPSGITSLDATVTVPPVTCPPTGSYSSYLSSQASGTTVSGGAFVHLACTNGVASYSGFVTFVTVTNGTKHFAVAAGDTLHTQLTVTVTKKGTTAVHEVVTDETSGVVTTKAVAYAGVAVDTTAADVFEHVGNAAVPPFTTADWTAATANGLTLAAANASQYAMVETGVTLVSASALGATGSTFSVKFHAST